ncbi:9058_t:CDS:2, partial [Gigaspora rosea]
CASKDKLLAEEYCYFLLKDRAYSLQVDSRRIVHGKISDIYAALNNRFQPRKELDVEISILLPRPLSAFVNPLVEVWEALIKNNFKKRNLTIHLSTIKENHTLQRTIELEHYKLDQLDKEDYPSLLKILRGIMGDRKIILKFDSELKIQKPSI